jgi:hypothetical protein
MVARPIDVPSDGVGVGGVACTELCRKSIGGFIKFDAHLGVPSD